MYDAPYMTYMTLYIISMQLINTNSRTSNHWKLNLESGKVLSVSPAADFDSDADNVDEELIGGAHKDPLFDILTSRVQLDDGHWKIDPNSELRHHDSFCTSRDCQKVAAPAAAKSEKQPITIDRKNRTAQAMNNTEHRKRSNTSSCEADKSGCTKRVLDCGKPVNFTTYDHLRGVRHRATHPLVPEPDVVHAFRKNSGTRINMDELERRLRKAQKQHPKSSGVYNQIGNFHRVSGDARLSIDCFRKSLTLSPGNAEALLSLARVLLRLRYLDDALLLTRRALEAVPVQGSPWLHHFTLGEILAARGEKHEAELHLRHSLDLNPGYGPAVAQLQELSDPDFPLTRYTLFIILLLALAVLCGILTSFEGGITGSIEEAGDGKTQRHFNRAMAMRSIKLGINSRLMRNRKQAA